MAGCRPTRGPSHPVPCRPDLPSTPVRMYRTAAIASGNYIPGTVLIGGQPRTAGDYAWDLMVTDAAGATARRTFTLHVSDMFIMQGGLPGPVVGNALFPAIDTGRRHGALHLYL